MIKISNLKKEYFRNGLSFNSVDNVNLEIKDGEFIIINGKSGSGKTTLLNLISGITSATSGNILIDNVTTSKLDDTEMSKYRNENIGIISQFNTTLSYLNVIDNIIIPFFINRKVQDSDVFGRARFLLDKFKISHLENSYPSHLSGGELKKINICRALINNPKLILADEPTASLDNESKFEIMDILSEINRENNTTLIVVTHDLDILKYSNNVYNMDNGNIFI